MGQEGVKIPPYFPEGVAIQVVVAVVARHPEGSNKGGE